MIVKKKAVAPTANKTSTEKKVAAVRLTDDAITATDTKKALAEPRVSKPTVKKASVVSASVLEEKKAPAKKETAKKAPAKKASAKTAAKKTTVKRTAAKTVAKKEAAKTAIEEKFVIQFSGKDLSKEEMMNRMNQIWVEALGKKASALKKVAFYVKPEESMVYYVANDTITGQFEI